MMLGAPKKAALVFCRMHDKLLTKFYVHMTTCIGKRVRLSTLNLIVCQYLTPMNLPSGLLLLCLTLTSSVWAEEPMLVKTENAAVNRELVWPEIKDSQALIDFAKTEIEKLKANGKKWSQFEVMRGVDYFSSHIRFWADVELDRVWIDFDTHPYTGQGLFVLADPNILPAKASEKHFRVFDTAIPRIKRVLRPLASLDSDPMILLGRASVRWQNIQNLDREKYSTPVVLQMCMPQYPTDLIRQGISGEAAVRFTVSERGVVTEIDIRAKFIELEAPIGEAMRQWRFEPGVDLDTRMSAATRMSLKVKFEMKDD